MRSRGFTLVELLIVIVVIAILAAISVVAYNGIQERGRDAQRISDIQSIVKGLELYKIQNGDYPVAVGAPGEGGWELSTAEGGEFLAALRTSGVMSQVGVDPVNNRSDNYYYRYYRYPAGHNGCDATKGTYYVLRVTRGESSSVSPSMPAQLGCGSAPSAGGWYQVSRFSRG